MVFLNEGRRVRCLYFMYIRLSVCVTSFAQFKCRAGGLAEMISIPCLSKSDPSPFIYIQYTHS